MLARLTVLGSGTSMGVPTIACDCRVCRSTDPHDKRLRPSILLEWEGHAVMIDSTPDFRTQALNIRLQRLDAVLYTHGHADHIMGLDDLRPLTYDSVTGGEPLPLYADKLTCEAIRRSFGYVFPTGPRYPGVAQVDLREVDGAIDLFGVTFTPFTVMHGKLPITAWRFGSNAYITDFSEIPPEAMESLHGLDVLFLDALRHDFHPTHSTLENSLAIVAELQPQRAFFTHISHGLMHQETEDSLPDGVHMSYDGLTIDFEL